MVKNDIFHRIVATSSRVLITVKHCKKNVAVDAGKLSE